jgi:two-component system sensor histidine kinase HydH
LLRRSIDEREHGRLAVLDEELSRIRTLTDQVREFLKSGEGSPIELDPTATIRELAARLPIQVVVHDPPRPMRVVMDPDRFRSVITNLLQNATDALDETGGKTRQESAGDTSLKGEPVEVFVRRHRGMVEIDVADRGPGIPAADRSRVFDPFFTTKTHGSGVGLSVSRRFVEQAGGSLEARARDGGGTEMIIRLRGMEHESTHS